MRFMVTGAAGFIGSSVVDALVRRGHEVVGLDAIVPTAHRGCPDYLSPGARWVLGDVRDSALLDRELRGIDAISHQAALVGYTTGLDDAPLFVGINGVGTATLLRAAARARVARIVLASSMVVYGDGACRCPEHGRQRPPPRRAQDLSAGRFDPLCPVCGRPLVPGRTTEDEPLDPRTVYAATKVHQEHLATVAASEGGPVATLLRYHNVFGPRMPRSTPYAGVASVIRSHIAGGRAPRVFEDGGQLRDFVSIERVTAANVAALERGDPYAGPLNVGSGEPHTILELARALSSALDARMPVVTGEYRMGDVRHIVASSARAERELGLAAPLAFAEAMARFARAPLRESVA